MEQYNKEFLKGEIKDVISIHLQEKAPGISSQCKAEVVVDSTYPMIRLNK
jgi:hypothetical protein